MHSLRKYDSQPDVYCGRAKRAEQSDYFKMIHLYINGLGI